MTDDILTADDPSDTPDAETTSEDWRDHAAELHDRGGIPETRARVVALITTGHTHAEVQEILGLSSRGEVSTHVKRYRESDLPQAKWLTEHAPEI